MSRKKQEEFKGLIKLYDLTYTTLGKHAHDDIMRRRLHTILNTVFDLIADRGHEDSYNKWSQQRAAKILKRDEEKESK